MPTTMTIKELNTDRIKTALKSVEFGTKISLSNATGLSVATCGNILTELISTGEVIELDLSDSTGGRPSRRFKYNKYFSYALSLYVRKEGKTNTICYVVSNLLGEKVIEKILPLEKIYLEEIDKLIDEIIILYPDLKVIAIGVPGIVQNGSIKYCDFVELSNLDLSGHLEETFSMKVIVENDVNASSLGFFQKGAYMEGDSLVYIYYPIEGGPGAGIIVNGSIIRGSTNYAGEVGNLPLGLNCHEQGNLQKDSKNFNLYVAKTILSINCIINPKTIVLSGLCFSEEALDEIQLIIKERLPIIHIPDVYFEKDFHESYIKGLTSMALEALSCQYQIIER